MRVQKVQHLYKELEKANPRCHGEEYCLFMKYDGWYGYLDLGGHISSRVGRTIPSMLDFGKDIKERMPNNRGRLIFEILIPDMDFPELNGVLNRKFEQAEDALIMVHDWVPEDSEHIPFIDRFNLAAQVVQVINHKRVILAPMIDSSSCHNLWKDTVSSIWDNGGEGLILKRRNAPYGAAVRNYDLMKIKEELTLDLLVVGMEEGKGKYDGTLGALVLLDSKNTLHTVSGMTDTMRVAWWENREMIVGKVVEVKAMKWLPDGQLREPRFVSIRYDKLPSEID